LLKKIYRNFHETIAQQLPNLPKGHVVELGAGVADITNVIPGCIRTDIFPNPWINRLENAYDLSFSDASVSALILFDVFHHLRYPGTALREFHRVLLPAGRVILFEPCVSLLGLFIYGVFHDEPLALKQAIQWEAPESWSPADLDYYAAQGNATRIFMRREIRIAELGWRVLTTKRLSAISYVASGGYSKPQMYPDKAFPLMRLIDKMCDLLPSIFSTRLLVVLEKTVGAEPDAAAAPSRHQPPNKLQIPQIKVPGECRGEIDDTRKRSR
jgi:SAM-dependent methyltransferase